MHSRRVSRKQFGAVVLLSGLCATAVSVVAAASARSESPPVAVGRYIQVDDMSVSGQEHLASRGVTGPLIFEGTAGGKAFMSGTDDGGNTCKVIGRSAELADVVICATPDNPILSSNQPALLVPALYMPAARDGQPDESRLRLAGLWGFVRDGLTVRLVTSDGAAENIPVVRGIFGVDTPTANAIRVEVADEQGRVVQAMTLR